MILYAPAKVNLYLRVLGRHSDGYHDIETVFEKIALFDRIILNPLRNGSVKIFCDSPNVPTGKQSLIRKTVDILRKEKGISKGAEIKVFKKIPIAAGLGGGSSDAASILKGLKRLWGVSLSQRRLAELGKKLGADVPFFLRNYSFASGRGRGDVIKKLGWKKKFWHLIVNPPVKLLSKDVYMSLGKTEKIRAGTVFPRIFRRKNGIYPYFSNDLEKAVFQKAPLVHRLKKALIEIGAEYSLVSGSGPSVFSLFEKRKEAIRAKKLLVKHFPAAKRRGWRFFTVSTL